MALNIKIENFEGPFDLLLHLIKENKLNIYNIKVSEITNQYIQYINSMKEMDLEITSEFILMAATLINIKSKELLPKELNDETAMTLEEKDQERDLLEKLIQYKKFKASAAFLRDKMTSEEVMFTKKPEVIEEEKPLEEENIFKNITMLDLYNLYNELIRIYANKINIDLIPKEIPIDKYKIEDKMLIIKDFIMRNKRTTFNEIAKGCSCKIEVVVSFLALLELIRLKTVQVVQEGNFLEIIVERSNDDE
ncbi:segregation/condensation protein A [uncultured Clostridium sp.]|uniref:segregation/condensation protein A n=1 Tax=uncultured Clostridium sp. TaxID=59620 RepID=UPI0028EA41B4|nr:segregation/condensation protein A [uncultured Clostridium sp.]